MGIRHSPIYKSIKNEYAEPTSIRATKQLKDLLNQIEELKTIDTTPEFQAGVDAAQAVISTVIQEATDRERIQKLEAELTQLRAKYPSDMQAAPKKRGRKPKYANPQEQTLLETE